MFLVIFLKKSGRSRRLCRRKRYHMKWRTGGILGPRALFLKVSGRSDCFYKRLGQVGFVQEEQRIGAKETSVNGFH